MSAIEAVFRPASVAVVGATPDEGKPGGRCIAFLKRFGFQGPIYPVNPRYDEIIGFKAYSDIASLPGKPDLVVLLVPAAATSEYLRAAATAGARAAVVCASGFAEAGAAGRVMQDEMAAIARETGLAIVGPNSLGVIDLHHRLTATFSTGLQSESEPVPGPIAFISQSGAVGAIVMRLAQEEGVGFGKVVSSGNEACLDFTDYLTHFSADPDVELVLGYIEGLGRGRDFVRAARAARQTGRVVCLLKVGRSDAGMRAARSHTGALVGSAAIYDAAFRRAGVLQVDDIRELLDVALAEPARNGARGNRLGIVSMSGGAGVLIADRASASGLVVGTLAEATREGLARVLPEFSGMANPVDYGAVYGSADAIEACVDLVVADPGIDAAIVFIGLSPRMAGIIEPRLAAIRQKRGKPLVVAWLGGPREGLERLRGLGVPAYGDVGRAVAIVRQLVTAGAALPAFEEQGRYGGERAEATRRALSAYAREGRTALTEREVKALLAPYGVPVVKEELARSPEEAAAIAAKLGVFLAIKAEAPELLHKSDAGAVALNIAPDKAADAFQTVTRAAAAVVGEAGVRGALIQPMVRSGLEILAGLRFDPQFGPTLTVGLGGVTSEVLADVATELAPVDLDTARAMLARLKSTALLGTFRGSAPRDTEALARMLVALSDFAMDAGARIAELDLNPVFAHEAGAGCTVVDAVAVIDPAAA